MRPDKAGAMRVLILGGTTEASALVRAVGARGDLYDATLSLAGRTTAPRAEPVRTRVGGFGGADGLADWIAAHGIARVVDATHPFAAQISRNAAQACARTEIPLLAVRRAAWNPVDGDRWIEVAGMDEAATALGRTPRRVFLTIGRQEVSAFASAPQHAYLVRTIEPLGDALPVPRLRAITARGPFLREAEAALMAGAGIEIVVTKNAGGAATYAKIAAARDLGLPVVMIRRPELPEVPSVTDAREALGWLSGA